MTHNETQEYVDLRRFVGYDSQLCKPKHLSGTQKPDVRINPLISIDLDYYTRSIELNKKFLHKQLLNNQLFEKAESELRKILNGFPFQSMSENKSLVRPIYIFSTLLDIDNFISCISKDVLIDNVAKVRDFLNLNRNLADIDLFKKVITKIHEMLDDDEKVEISIDLNLSEHDDKYLIILVRKRVYKKVLRKEIQELNRIFRDDFNKLENLIAIDTDYKTSRK